MEFVHETYQPGETISAIATPPGEGGVAIVRISGDDALEVANRIFTGPVNTYKSHTMHYGQILNTKGEVVDSVLLLVMLGKRSFTGENTVEIHCHGGSLITRRVLDVVLKAGVRSARPGEFTLKAFMNGKLDLVQAEAIQELICAKNERALDAAENQLEGNLSKKVIQFQKELTDVAAILEAWVDFPEEGLEFSTIEEIISMLQEIQTKMETLVRTFHEGKILHEGLSLCLAGCPNVGKSSLMNALLEKERAIVTHVPGTTRDILEDHIRLSGINIRLSDTAGIHQAEEIVEKEGIRRTKKAIKEADIVLMVMDAHKGINKEDQEIIETLPSEKTLGVWNKIDLVHNGFPSLSFPVVPISAKRREGIALLKKKIDEVIWKDGPPSREEVVITNVRHKEALEGSCEACQKVIEGLRGGVSPEFISIDMRQALNELGKIIGTNITEGILSSIFSKFCIGK